MDKTMKHTPGPWNVDSFADGDLNLIYGSDGEFVTYCNANPNRGSDHGERAQANARLIAAAPRMHSLVERVANLNAAIGEIGPGMLAQLVAEANAILEEVNGRS